MFALHNLKAYMPLYNDVQDTEWQSVEDLLFGCLFSLNRHQAAGKYTSKEGFHHRIAPAFNSNVLSTAPGLKQNAA